MTTKEQNLYVPARLCIISTGWLRAAVLCKLLALGPPSIMLAGLYMTGIELVSEAILFIGCYYCINVGGERLIAVICLLLYGTFLSIHHRFTRLTWLLINVLTCVVACCLLVAPLSECRGSESKRQQQKKWGWG